MNKKFLILASWFALVSPCIAWTQYETDVYLGQVPVDIYVDATPPIKDIVILSDSTKNGVLIPSPRWPNGKSGNALYSIYDSEGGCILPPTPVCEDGVVHIDEIDLSSVGTYQLKIVATEDCVLQLTTGSFYDVPQKEEIPLSSSVTYGLDIVVEDDEGE